jgi:hypothetical protein
VSTPQGGGAILLGKVRLLSILGKAGSRVTYEAELVSPAPSRARVSVRVTPIEGGAAGDVDANAKRLAHEAEVLGRMAHPALPRFVEHFVADVNGAPASCIVRDLPDAESLAWLVARRGPVPEAEVTRIAKSVLELIVYLHGMNVFHSEISPSNVLRTHDGRVFVVDYGEPPRGDGQSATMFDYRAPEAAAGKVVPSSDLYAVGATLAFVLAGRAPPDATQLRAYARAAAKSPRFAEWLAKLVAQSPEERFPSAQVALDALRGAPVSSSGVSLPKKLPVPWSIVGAAAGGLFALVIIVSLVVSHFAAKRREAEAAEEEARQVEQRRSEAIQAAENVGCADGTREAFRDALTYPGIAGCSGAFTVPGINVETPPSCDRAAGNNGKNFLGSGCSATDLCAEGFHVCRSAPDVAAHSTTGCRGANDAALGSFFATRQSGPGCSQCATGDDPGCDSDSCRPGCAPTPAMADDLFGCGTAGRVVTSISCAPLTRSSDDLCRLLPSSWHCKGGPNAQRREAAVVAKPESTGGGVLCCAD